MPSGQMVRLKYGRITWFNSETNHPADEKGERSEIRNETGSNGRIESVYCFCVFNLSAEFRFYISLTNESPWRTKLEQSFEVNKEALNAVKDYLLSHQKLAQDVSSLASEYGYDRCSNKYMLAELQSIMTKFANMEWQLAGAKSEQSQSVKGLLVKILAKVGNIREEVSRRIGARASEAEWGYLQWVARAGPITYRDSRTGSWRGTSDHGRFCNWNSYDTDCANGKHASSQCASSKYANADATHCTNVWAAGISPSACCSDFKCWRFPSPIWRNSGLVSSNTKGPSTGASQQTFCLLQQRRETTCSVWPTFSKTSAVRGNG